MPAIDAMPFCRPNPTRLPTLSHQPPGIPVHLLDLLIVRCDP
jgi:hypothetical protein